MEDSSAQVMAERPCQTLDGTGLFWRFMVTSDDACVLKVDTLHFR